MARASGSYPEGRWFDSTRRYHFYKNCLWTFSSAGRASALQAEGHRFEPYSAHHEDGLVVQLVRMPACHAGGRRFEPVPDRQFLFRGASSLRRHSQVVRQRSAKPLFPGSNPGVASNMVGIVKWLRQRVVAPLCVGSNPTIHPIYMNERTLGYRQAVRQWILIPSCAGSNPATLANEKARSECFGSFAVSRKFSDCT